MAFMFPPGGDISFERPPFEHHLGVAYIQAYLAKYGITSKQVTPSSGSTINGCVEQLIETGANIFGFTCYDENYYLVRAIASRIKHRKPESVVIVGGPTATFSDELILANARDIDLCVRFEGEETTLELATAYLEGRLLDDLEEIAGITYRRDDSIIRIPDRELFGSSLDKNCGLDGLPSPYLDGLLNGTEGAGIISARGCTHNCTYCNFSAMSKHVIRYHSIDRVIAELEYISAAIEANPTNSMPNIVNVNDDAFTLNLRRAKDICERIIEDHIKLKLSCLCRADNIDEELIKLLSQAGFVDITFGVESAVPRVLRTIKKIRNADLQFEDEAYLPEKRFLSRVKKVIGIAKRNGMKTNVSIILGLPGETIEDGLKTIEFISDLDVDYYAHNYLKLFAGTELFKTANNFGIKFKSSEFILPYITQHAYPVHEIPFGHNSSFQLSKHKFAKIVLKNFAGGLVTFRGSEDGIILSSIEGFEGNLSFASFSWLSQALAVGQGRVFLIGHENENMDNFDLKRKVSNDISLPASQCYYLKSRPFAGTELIYEIINKPLSGELLQWNPRFPLVRFSKSLEFAKMDNLTQDDIFPVFCLSEKIDVRFLANIADILAQQVKSETIGPKVWLDGVFLDGCRWCKGLCPALKLQRVVINKSGEILPCMTGQPLGNLQDSVKDLRDNAKKIYARIREERKCSECPADSRCSKCLFPYPLDQQEYCGLQCENLNISGIVTRSNLVNTTELGQ